MGLLWPGYGEVRGCYGLVMVKYGADMGWIWWNMGLLWAGYGEIWGSYGLVMVGYGAVMGWLWWNMGLLLFMKYTIQNINKNTSNMMEIYWKRELIALSARYCNSRWVSEKIHTYSFHTTNIYLFLPLAQSYSYLCNIRMFLITVTPLLQPIAWISNI